MMYTKNIEILENFNLVKFTFLLWVLCLNVYYIECNTYWKRTQISPVVILTFLSITFIITKIRKK
jgi:hypothetical protein